MNEARQMNIVSLNVIFFMILKRIQWVYSFLNTVLYQAILKYCNGNNTNHKWNRILNSGIQLSNKTEDVTAKCEWRRAKIEKYLYLTRVSLCNDALYVGAIANERRSKRWSGNNESRNMGPTQKLCKPIVMITWNKKWVVSLIAF